MGIHNNKMGNSLKSLAAICLAGFFSQSALAFQIEDVNFDNTFALQSRFYDNYPVSPEQRRNELLTAYFQQEISYSWNNGKDSWVFTPYLSVTRFEDPIHLEHEGFVPFVIPIPIFNFGETRTAHRSYGDIREFLWTHVADSNRWETRMGIGKVFWGVTESQHLVDVINQDDLRSDVDGEDKLGQPMLNLTFVRDYGNFDFFVLPGFRERLFQRNEGRLNPVLVPNPYAPLAAGTNMATMVNQEDDALYESGAEELHTDFAFRWSHTMGIHDIAISYFEGTNRDPILDPINNPVVADNQFTTVQYVTPYYEQMTQVGLEYQATFGGWLLKFEGVNRKSDSPKTPLADDYDDDGVINGSVTDFTEDYQAITTGFEYTFNSIFGSTSDLGVLMEYSWDSRDFEATTPNQNDLFVGFRYAKNSVADPTILIGVIQDLDFDSYIAVMESSRRVGEDSKIILEGMTAYADGNAPNVIKGIGFDATTGVAKEDHVRLAWETYF